MYPQFIVNENDKKDWIKLVRAASSSYVVRITNILSKLQKV
jgi:hypothetical protein